VDLAAVLARYPLNEAEAQSCDNKSRAITKSSHSNFNFLDPRSFQDQTLVNETWEWRSKHK